jgi:hypothetical protein
VRNHINNLVVFAGVALVFGALAYWGALLERSPYNPSPTTGEIFRVSIGKTHRYVTTDEERNYYISWGALIVGAIVITAIQKGAWDFSGKT